MKANRNFKEADEAVSPVIGVILMVAITVVLAAVVFVLVNDLGSGADSAPTIGFTKDESNDQIDVTKAPADPSPWTDISISVSANATTLRVAETGAAGTGSDLTTAFTPTGNIAAADYLEFCNDTTAVSDITITLVHDPTGTVLQEFDFNSIAVCA